VSPVGQSIAQVDFDALFELTSVFHGVPVIRWWLNSPNYPTRESLASPADDRQPRPLLLRRALHLAAALAINCRPSWRWATLRHSIEPSGTGSGFRTMRSCRTRISVPVPDGAQRRNVTAPVEDRP